MENAETIKRIKEMGWEDFIMLNEVETEGTELYYNDGVIQVFVPYTPMLLNEDGEIIQEGHDADTLWEDEELAEELKAVVIKEYESLPEYL